MGSRISAHRMKADAHVNGTTVPSPSSNPEDLINLLTSGL
jgi:hypothetical protein